MVDAIGWLASAILLGQWITTRRTKEKEVTRRPASKRLKRLRSA